MNKITLSTITLFAILISLFGCKKSTNDNISINENQAQLVTVSGEIVDFKDTIMDNTIKLYIHDAGKASTLGYFSQIDKDGLFSFQFKRYIPQDVVIEYGTNFKVFVHPGDSIHVKFKSTPVDRIQLLKSVEFSGDASNANTILAQYQLDYFSNYHQNLSISNFKDFDIDRYKSFSDSIYSEMLDYLAEFTKTYEPNLEIKQWIYWDIEMDRAINLLSFTRQYRTENKLAQTWLPSDDYYEFLEIPLSMNKSALTNSKLTRWFINKYLHEYIFVKALVDIESKSIIGKLLVASKGIDASLLKNIKTLTEKNFLLRQLCYSAFFNDELEKQSIEKYEDNRKFIEQIITEPFLKYPLAANYKNTKTNIGKPNIASDAMLKKISSSSAKLVMDSIMNSNSDKVIYIDCWATWCAPCLSEMPNSKDLMNNMAGKDVAFVYMCLDSEESTWKATLSNLKLSGQHYFLTKEQSNDIRKVFGVNGIPHYFLINKQGTIVEKGSHLRPNNVKEKIEELLKEKSSA